MHILIVDDNSSTQELIASFLADFSITIEVASNGLDGYEKAQKNHFDLYIVDHLMPIMDGLQLVKNLKSRPSTVNTPVLFMSTQGVSEIEKLAEFPLFSAVMHKPIDYKIFCQFINMLLPENTRRQSL